MKKHNYTNGGLITEFNEIFFSKSDNINNEINYKFMIKNFAKVEI